MAGKKKHVWERQIEENEGVGAYNLFLIYLEMGPVDRSARNVAEMTGRNLVMVEQLQHQFKWISRAKAWDERMFSIAQKATERAVRDQSIKNVQRRMEVKEEEFTVARQLIAKGREMLNTPLYETVDTRLILTESGDVVTETITIKPARWTLRDAPRFIEAASTLFRLSLEMETSRETINVNLSENPEARLNMARAALDKARKDTDRLVAEMIAADPAQDPEDARRYVLENAPRWAAEDFDVDPALLLEEEPVDPYAVDVTSDNVS